MLLNTHVADGMYNLLGEKVPHSTTGSKDPCGVKKLRRMRAMNLLQQDGFPPTYALWKEPGLSICKVRVKDSGAFVIAYRDDGKNEVVYKDHGVDLVACIAAEMGFVIDADDDAAAVVVLRFPEIIIRTITGKRIRVRIPLSCNGSELKLTVQDCEGIPPGLQKLVFKGKQLSDATSLSEAGVTDGSDVVINLSC